MRKISIFSKLSNDELSILDVYVINNHSNLNIDEKYLSKITATAELNWCLLLSLARNIRSVFNSTNEDNWDRNLFIGDQLYGKNLGIIGFGRLGKMIANYGNSFKMNVHFFVCLIVISLSTKNNQG